jgi:hypothetical protein
MMKKYIYEIIFVILQAITFFVVPLSFHIRPINAGTTVLILIGITGILSILLGFLSKNKIKFFYPIVTALMFLPSIMMYYNESAMIHSVWYLIVSVVGILMGVVLKDLVSNKDKKE